MCRRGGGLNPGGGADTVNNNGRELNGGGRAVDNGEIVVDCITGADVIPCRGRLDPGGWI